MDTLVILGVILCLMGSVGNNLGNNIQSLGLQRTASNSGASGGKRIWVVGTVIFVTGAMLIFASFGFAAASLLAPIEAIQFVTNVFFGKFVLKRTVTKKMLVGTALIVAGTLLAVMMGSHKSQKLSIDDLLALWTEFTWLAFVTFLATLASFAWLLHQLFNFRKAQGKPLPYDEWISPLTYALFSAIAGTQSVVQAKCLSELVEQWTTGADNIFVHWFPYACLLAWFGLVGIWVFQLNKALGIYDPLFMIPLLQANFILFAVLSGGVYFREFVSFDVAQWFGFFGGIAIMFAGLYLLSSAGISLSKEDHNFEAPPELQSPKAAPNTVAVTVGQPASTDPWNELREVAKTCAPPACSVCDPAENPDMASKKVPGRRSLQHLLSDSEAETACPSTVDSAESDSPEKLKKSSYH